MQKDKNNVNDNYKKNRKKLYVISFIVILLLIAAITLFIWRWLASFSQEDFREYIFSYGTLSWLVLLVLQILQVFIALIPGELLETAAGFVFGPWVGTLICYIGVSIGSVMIFLLVKKFGTKLVELFISKEKINELKFINTEKKLNTLVFLLFFIPGTPKDLITYFVPLTRMKLSGFLAISLVARLPSVLSSTFGGHLLGEKDYIGAVLLYGITGIVSIVGILIYNFILRRKRTGEK